MVANFIFGGWLFAGNSSARGAENTRRAHHASSRDTDDTLSIREPSDEALVAHIRTGDRDAFDTLIRRYHGRLIASAESALGDRAAAEDVVQDILLRVWMNRGSWMPVHGAAAYFFGAVANRVRNVWRDRDRTVHALERVMHDEATEGEEAATDVGDVWDAVSQLPERWRTAIVLRYARDVAFADIGRMMGVSENAAKKLVRRALLALTEALTPK